MGVRGFSADGNGGLSEVDSYVQGFFEVAFFVREKESI